MAQQQVVFEEFIAAPREKVFAFFADHEKFGTLFGGKVKRIKDAPGADPNGLGSVRLIPGPGGAFEETIVSFQAPELIEYRVTRGSPIKNHLGRIEFHDETAGTKVRYTISFEPRIPLTGSLIAGILRASWCRNLPKAMEQLVRH
ncbi:MAG TPA: SRPBCC family protein [Candidatus Binatia bacterium]|nr:SRPBCC family protein [Candidatus Binatia bacterium]